MHPWSETDPDATCPRCGYPYAEWSLADDDCPGPVPVVRAGAEEVVRPEAA
jgi:hypothetical protein